MDNPWNLLYNLQYEQNILKEKYSKLMDIIENLLAALSQSEMEKIKKNEEKKKWIKCKFYNRGYCKEGATCEFAHPEENCQEFIDTGSCSAGRLCHGRHPHKCRSWLQGSCYRGSSCAYQHQECDKPEHIIEDEDDKDEDNEDEDNGDDTKNYNETDDEPESNEETDSPTTDEIIQMYENMSEDELFAEPFKVKKTTKKNIAKKSLTKPTLRRV